MEIMNNEQKDLLNQILFLKESAEKITPIHKGFSYDKKYLVSLKNGNRVLLRTADLKAYESKLAEFHMLGELNKHGVDISKPIEFGRLEELDICYMILSYIDGEDARDLLPTYSEKKQYEIGILAGQELWKMHQIPAPNNITSWESRIIPKYKRYLESYQNCGVTIKHDDKVINFIEENVQFIKGRPNVFQHDDFHVGNIIVNEGKYAGAIDINRYDWGDPIHEFYKVALFSRENSVPFSIGQIEGYFQHQGGVPEAFWRLYAIYTGMSILSSIVWTKKVTPHLMDEMMNRLTMIMKDHKNFELTRPVWFN
jgi:aminoglycoside phosphotransferase (APT) family kinase protein